MSIAMLAGVVRVTAAAYWAMSRRRGAGRIGGGCNSWRHHAPSVTQVSWKASRRADRPCAVYPEVIEIPAWLQVVGPRCPHFSLRTSSQRPSLNLCTIAPADSRGQENYWAAADTCGDDIAHVPGCRLGSVWTEEDGRGGTQRDTDERCQFRRA
ncbi:hypothetical protein B0T18DRAFT_55033 [Schizothecium vesticola]|uniref:Secreted protein n=1 Tax=Schizothecium vesticola TaxID=314040 RepID=A0AA40F3W9_9PEZI|nr:hypothetical protein B0T18DRAFT_55033 [Schizothecium vesticola]